MKKTIIATLLIASTSMALAADNWTGFYAGGNIGYGWADNKQTNNKDGYHKIKPKGVIGGIQAGYNYQFDNNFVIGAEAQFSIANIKKSENDSKVSSPYSPYSNTAKIKNAFSLNATAGYAVDSFLPYVTAGLTYGKREFGLACGAQYAALPGSPTCDGKNNNPEFNKTASKSSLGYNLGVGVKYRVSRDISIGAEYRYTKFSNKSVNLYDPKYPSKSKRDFKTSMNTLNFSVNYQF